MLLHIIYVCMGADTAFVLLDFSQLNSTLIVYRTNTHATEYTFAFFAALVLRTKMAATKIHVASIKQMHGV